MWSRILWRKLSDVAACLVLVSSLTYSSTSETSVDFRLITRRCVPEDRTFHSPRCDDLKSNILLDIVTIWRVTVDGVWIGEWIDYLYTRLGTTSCYSGTASLHSIHITTVSAKYFPACCVFTSRPLATASNSGDSSVSRAQVLYSRTPVQSSLGRPNCLQDSSSARTTWKHPVSNSTSIVARRSIAAGTCLPSCCLVTDLVYSPV
jgi:hypothetical protein